MLDRVMDEPTRYKYRQVPALFIQHAVWLHVRLTLSLRDSRISRRSGLYETIRQGRHGLTRSSRSGRGNPRLRLGDLDEVTGRVPPIDGTSDVSTARGCWVRPLLRRQRSDGPIWKHWLTIIEPERVATRTGLLIVGGGSKGFCKLAKAS
jgi:hypothetical protein